MYCSTPPSSSLRSPSTYPFKSRPDRSPVALWLNLTSRRSPMRTNWSRSIRMLLPLPVMPASNRFPATGMLSAYPYQLIACKQVRLILRLFIGAFLRRFAGQEAVGLAGPVGEVLEGNHALDRGENLDP